jgi:hypothetical protein
MKVRTRLAGVGTAVALAATIGIAPGAIAASAAPGNPGAAAAGQQHPGATVTSRIDQTIAGVGTVTGTFTPTKFSAQNGQLYVTGLVKGTLTTATGAVTPISQTATAPVIAATDPQCQILDLTLGPLHLNLLGLVVDLNQVHLNITAVSGPGNLLGNLLCAVANLLNGSGVGGALAGIVARLNTLLGML